MSMTSVYAYAAAGSLMIGSFFLLVGAIGLLKFSDPMARLHAPTKVGTIGIGMMLVASLFHTLAQGEASFHEVLILTFLFATAPVSAMFIAKVSLHRGECATPPPPDEDDTWATLSRPEEDRGSSV